ncbi:hypothetical protein [Melghirimyces algeriensis]|uniref:Uncharacterized protein n=1 Tax=Melghirimyces algeriensis TaxID=910412 RepID=A0A521B4V8_9BACL|nr:hypothetical protein [Melghirimyces algeriensis]SMO42134.1 hypothetical protein SAMN06264849_101555 [Melghirimyces algeriensis]
MNRLYLSSDYGAMALVAALRDLQDEGASMAAKIQQCTLWKEDIWSTPGRIYWVGCTPSNVSIYMIGTMWKPVVLERALTHILQLAGECLLEWEMIRLNHGCKNVKSWSGFVRNYPRLIRILSERG